MELKIIKQNYFEKYGNDCLIEDAFVLYKVFDTYVVENIRKYNGWCDDGLHYKSKKEFKYEYDALSYYAEIIQAEGYYEHSTIL